MPIFLVHDNALIGSTAFGNGRRLARASTGRLWCAYVRNDGVNDQIYVSYSDDDGTTWTEEQVTDIAVAYRPQRNPSIAIDSSDNIHVVWAGAGWAPWLLEYNIQYRRRVAGVWQAQEAVSDVRAEQSQPSIAIDSEDSVHVVWYGAGHLPVVGDRSIVYRSRTGLGWATEEVLAQAAKFQYSPAIAIDSDDNIHVVWTGRNWGDNPGNYNLQYIKRTAGIWGAQEAVSDKDAHQYRPSIAIDSEDNVHVVWYGTGWGNNPTIGNIQYRRRTTTWQTKEAITDSSQPQDFPTISIDKDDDVYVAWQGYGWGTNPTIRNIQVRKRLVGVWQASVGVTNRPLDQAYPNLIWAIWPMVSGERTNIPATGCGLAFTGQDAGGYNVEFYASSIVDGGGLGDLIWVAAPELLIISKAYALSREEL